MKVAWLLLMCAATAAAHVISMSNGYATVSGNRVDYILRMPDYEMPKNSDPTSLLLDRIHFTSGFQTAKRVDGECHHDVGGSVFLCAAAYVFADKPTDLNVECTFFDVTVPNHIHMLRAERDGKSDQAILDSSFASAPLRFRPPTAFEKAATEALGAAKRTVTTWAHLLLCLALIAAARTGRELAIFAIAFAIAQSAASVALLHSAWQPPPGFTEAAVALAVAYLAFEMLVLPKSGGRWLIAALFGAFSGSYFASFITESGFHPAWVLLGSMATSMFLILLGLPAFRLGPVRARLARVVSVPLLLAGFCWFVLRLRNG